MKNKTKTKAQLQTEMEELRRQLAALERTKIQEQPAQALISDREKRYRLLAENATDVIWTMNMNLSFTYMSPSVKRLRGYEIEQAMAHGLGEVLTPASIVIVAQTLAEELAIEEKPEKDLLRSRTLELEILRKDGSTIWAETTLTFLRDPDGQPLEILGVTRDISERKLAEEVARQTMIRWQREAAVVTAIAASEFLANGAVRELAVELTEAASGALEVERVGVWLFEEDGTRLVNVDNYFASTGEHSSGAVLLEHEYRNEFDALKRAKYVDAHDPLTDPRTAGYVEEYLKPNRITSMLDAVIRFAGKNLGTLCFEHVNKPHHWEDDEITFACQLADQVALAISIHKRKQMEIALQESEQRYRSLIEDSPIAIVVHSEGKIVYSNPAALKLVGATTEQDVLGKSAMDFVHPDYRDMVQERVKKIYEKKEVAPSIEEKFIRLNGQVIDVEVTAKIINFQNKPASQVIIQDITERKQAEHAFQESEVKYRSLIENSNDAIYLLFNRQFEIINKEFEKMFGYSFEEVNKPNFDFINLVAPKSQAKIENRAQRSARGAKLTPKFEFTALKKNGEEFEVETSNAYIIYKNGLAVQGVIRDITERKKAERQMQKDLKEKTILLSEIHHRVKNNLQVVASLLYLQSRKITDKRILDLFDQSRNRILFMAKVYEKLYQSESFANIDFKEYAEDVLINAFRTYGLSHRVNLKMEVQNVVLGLSDAIPLALILNELLTNSVKHAFPGNRKGEIEIKFTPFNKETYQLIYRDNGVGLPARINFDATETLGLNLIKNLAQQIEGEATLEQNGWTTFKIVFKGYGSDKDK